MINSQTILDPNNIALMCKVSLTAGNDISGDEIIFGLFPGVFMFFDNFYQLPTAFDYNKSYPQFLRRNVINTITSWSEL